MAETGFSPFNTMVDKANRVLKQIEEAYGWPKERRKQSYAALRVVLHLLRDRLPVDEAVHFGAQLPTLVRGIYYDGYDPSQTPTKMDADEFFAHVRKEFRYDIEGDVELLVHTVLASLQNHVSSGEWDDIKSTVPRRLTAVIP